MQHSPSHSESRTTRARRYAPAKPTFSSAMSSAKPSDHDTLAWLATWCPLRPGLPSRRSHAVGRYQSENPRWLWIFGPSPGAPFAHGHDSQRFSALAQLSFVETLSTQEGNGIDDDEFLRSHSQIQLPGDREPVPIIEHSVVQQDHVHNGICAALPVRDRLCAHGGAQPVPGRGPTVPKKPTRLVLRVVDLLVLISPATTGGRRTSGFSRCSLSLASGPTELDISSSCPWEASATRRFLWFAMMHRPVSTVPRKSSTGALWETGREGSNRRSAANREPIGSRRQGTTER